MIKTRFLALAIGLTAVLAACSGSGASTAPSAAASAAPSAAASEAPSAPASEAPSAAASEAPSAAAGATVSIADSPLGKILVDSAGMTLYMFTPDEGGTPTCYGDCATNWPALTATGTPTAGEGVVAALATVARTDGATQVKAGEYPLYTFAKDKAPGDTNGQGAGSKWYVVGADGEPIK
jgi:predicted lipoprotein with Yx(FWY)xxD motif